MASGRRSDSRSDHLSSSETIIGVEIYRYCGETQTPVEVKDKLQNGNDVLGGQKKLVENLNSRFKKKKKVSCEFKSVICHILI